MALADEIARDWEDIDGVEDVTITPLNDATTIDPVTTVKALQRQVSRVDIQLFGGVIGLEPEDTVFHVWKYRAEGSDDLVTALTRKPRNGDTITQSDGSRWTIIGGQYSPQTSRWRFICRSYVQ